jgi:hypothetical protein
MTLYQKRSIGALFCIGWVCIIFATIRVVEVGNNYSEGMPNPAWLALWGVIESSIGIQPTYTFILSIEHRLTYVSFPAVIIGCCPGLYRFIKTHTSKTGPTYQYDSHGFQWNSGNAMPSHRSYISHGDGDIILSQMPGNSKARHMSGLYSKGAGRPQNDAGSSQEELARHSDDKIVVTQRVSVTVKDREMYI